MKKRTHFGIACVATVRMLLCFGLLVVFFSSFKARTVRYRCKLKRPLAASVTKHALYTHLISVFIYSRWSRSKPECQFFHKHDIPTVIRIRLSFVWMCVDANKSKKKRATKQEQQQLKRKLLNERPKGSYQLCLWLLSAIHFIITVIIYVKAIVSIQPFSRMESYVSPAWIFIEFKYVTTK